MNPEDITPAEAGSVFGDAILVVAVLGLAGLGIRRLVRSFGTALQSTARDRWVGPVGYVLAIGALVPLGAYIVTPVALGIALGLAAVVVGGAALDRWRALQGQVPRKPGHDEDV